MTDNIHDKLKWAITYKTTFFVEDTVVANSMEEALEKWGDGDSECIGVTERDEDAECELVRVEVL